MSVLFKPISAMEKCFLDEDFASKRDYPAASCLLGEEFSYQAAYTGDGWECDPKAILYLEVDSPLAEYITVRSVESVPVRFPAYSGVDDYYLRKTPGLYPDLLQPFSGARREVYVSRGQLKAVYVTVKVPADGGVIGFSVVEKAREFPIVLRLVDGGGNVWAECCFTLRVINAVLPEQRMTVTEWFHCDCIANYYGLDVFGERHWEYIEKFMQCAVENGINMILTPILTPALDTAVGGERLTTQLVDVYLDECPNVAMDKCPSMDGADGVDGASDSGSDEFTSDIADFSREISRWSFKWDRFERWVELCRKVGVRYLEIPPLYTQWGAAHAPKVMAYVGGELKRVFGWETDSTSREYHAFLRALLSSLLEEAKKLGVEKMLVFHISDEPSGDNLEHYMRVKAQVDLIADYPIIDALSDVEFYKSGVISHPIPSTNHVKPFLEAGVPDLWVYYCCGQTNVVSNRLLAMPSQRTRVIGAQFWKFNIAGFLQWGFNFYNNQYSTHEVNPFYITDGDWFVPAGDCYAVYPGVNGEPWESLHMKAFTQALYDVRAMELAEQLCGRDAVMGLVDSRGEVEFDAYPRDEDYVEWLRESVNRLIEGEI